MKKAFVVILCLLLALSCAIPSIVALAEPEQETPVREPVTVTFDSSVHYKNAYKDVNVDVTFTHEDGTTISLPCFWYGDDTFAFRFSPTKEGLWSYKVTCDDPENASLQKTGTVKATAPKGDTNTSKHGFVQAEVGTRYLHYEDGTPFFWLGDTNWQSFATNSTTKCNYPGCDCGGQFQHIVNNRASKGFTVYQTYFTAGSEGSGQGNKPFWKTKGTKVDPEVFNERIDFEFQYLHEKDLVAAVGFGCHFNTTDLMSREDMIRLARYVVARYACYNVIWISGQEITDSHKAGATSQKDGLVTAFDVYMAVSESLETVDGYHHPNTGHMHVHDSKNDMAQQLSRSAWHDFWLVQGGHSSVHPSKEYYQSYYTNYYATADRAVKAFVEGELNYEEINCAGYTGYEPTRWYAWGAMMNGGAGYTYGAGGIWAACFSTSEYTGWYGGDKSYSYEPWYMTVDKPASVEMTYMKNFFEALPDWTKLVPAFYDKKLADFLADETKLMSYTEDKAVIVCYFRNEDTKTGTILCLDEAKQYAALWYNPLTGSFIPVGAVPKGTRWEAPDKPTTGDWVLLLTSEDIAAGTREELPTFADAPASVEGTVVTPVSFKAIGGVTYAKGQIMEDPTALLTDGDKATVWEPSADRVTQTFYYDLGKAMDLSAVLITPKAGTVLPDMRVYGSNDEKNWTILCDTQLAGVQHKIGDDYAEALSGGYRYVRVLLLTAYPIPEAEVENVTYEVHYNPASNHTYSHTAICELALYARGEAAAPTEKASFSGKLADVLGELPADPTAAPGEPGAPDGPGATDEPGNNGSGKTPWGLIAGIAGGAAVVIAAVVAVVLAKKKKKEQ